MDFICYKDFLKWLLVSLVLVSFSITKAQISAHPDLIQKIQADKTLSQNSFYLKNQTDLKNKEIDDSWSSPQLQIQKSQGMQNNLSTKLADAGNNPKSVADETVTWSSTNGGNFSSATSTTNSSGVATVKAGNASKYIVTSSENNPTAGSNVTITAQLADSNNNSVSAAGKIIKWSKTGTSGTFNPTKSTTDGTGKATVTFTVGTTSGTVYMVTGTDNSSPALTGISDNITVKAGAANKYIVTASRYSPVAGVTVKVTAQLSDQYGNSVSVQGKNLTWSSVNGGSFNNTTSSTDENGKSSVSFTTSNAAPPVTHVVSVKDDSTPQLTGTSKSITTTEGPAVKYIVTSSDNNPAAGSNVTITAQLVDAGNNPKTDTSKIVTWSKTGKGGTFGTATSQTDGTGKATVTFTVGETAGTIHKVTATDNSSPALTGTSGNITVNAGSAGKYVVTSSDKNTAAGSGVTITAQLIDQYNNNVTIANKIITWSKTGTGGTFNSATSVTDATGKATVTFTVSQISGTVHTVTATDDSSPALTGTSGNITVKAGSASSYAVTSSDNNPAAGSNITISSQLIDQYSNNVAAIGKIITWSSTNGGSFSKGTSTTNSSGVATVTFTVGQIASIIQTVTATDDSSPSLTGTSGNITVKAAAAGKYIVTSDNYNPLAGSNITITAQLTDQYNNNLITSGKIVTWSKSGAGGSFSAVTSTTNSSGIATVTFTVSQTAGTIYSITATDNSTPAHLIGTSGNITVATEAACKYLITSVRTNVAAGDTVKITGQLIDQYGNAVSTNGKTVNWTSTGTGGSFSAASSVTDVNGKVITVFTVNTVSGTVHTVKGKDTDNLEGTSGNITVLAAAAGKYVVGVSRNNPAAGDTVKVNAQLSDQYGNSVSTPGKTVTWSSTNGGSFASATSLTSSSGIATVIFTTSQTANIVHIITATDNTSLTGTSEKITTIIVTPKIPALISPVNNAAKVPVNITLSWSKVDYADTYNLQLSKDSTFAAVDIEKTNINSTTFSVNGLSYYSKYFWHVNAKNTAGTSAYSAINKFTTIDTVVAPTNLNISVDTLIHANLTWKDNSNNEIGFNIERKDTTATQFVQIASVSGGVTNYQDQNVKQGKSYQYRVKAYNNNAESNYSNIETVILPVASIKPPSNLTYNPDSLGHLTLKWTNPNTTDSIEVDRSSNPSSSVINNKVKGILLVTTTWIKIAMLPANSTSYYDNSTTIGVLYNYRVTAIDKQGSSFSATTPNPIVILKAPSSLKVVMASNSYAKLTWLDNSTDETGFIILRASKPDMQFRQFHSLPANTISYNDDAVSDGTKYFYKVYGFNNSYGQSGVTNSDSVLFAMNAPTNLTAIQTANQNKIVLTWKDNSSSELGYKIERKEISESNFTQIAEVNADIVTYTDESVSNHKSYSYRVKGYNSVTESDYINSSSVTTGIKVIGNIPAEFSLLPNYPNPFNPSTNIRYNLAKQSNVSLTIYNILGQRVSELIHLQQDAGSYEVRWNAAGISSGIYFYRITAIPISGTGVFSSIRKMLIIK